jgi:hypothetical protein
MKKDIAHLSEDQLWDLSEIFNVILLRSPRYHNIVDAKNVFPYPDHKRYLPEFEQAYTRSKNAKEFIIRGVKILKK